MCTTQRPKPLFFSSIKKPNYNIFYIKYHLLTKMSIGRDKFSITTQIRFVLAFSLIVSAKTLSSYSKLQGSFSHKSYYTHTHKRMKYGLRGPVTEHNRTLSVECDNPIFIPFHSHEITISITSHAEPR